MLLCALFHFGSIHFCWGLLIKLKLQSLVYLLCWIILSWKLGFFCHQFHFNVWPQNHLHPFCSRCSIAQQTKDAVLSKDLKSLVGVFSANRSISTLVESLHYLNRDLMPSFLSLGPEAPRLEIKRTWFYFLYFSSSQWFVKFIFESADAKCL